MSGNEKKNGRGAGRSVKSILKWTLITVLGLIVVIYGLLIIFPDLK